VVSQFRLQVLPGWNTTLLPSCIILLVYPQEDCVVPVPAAGVAWLEHNPASQLCNIAVNPQEDCGVPVPAAGVAWLEHNPAAQLLHNGYRPRAGSPHYRASQSQDGGQLRKLVYSQSSQCCGSRVRTRFFNENN
jgi:hypothetical protein